MIANYKGKDFFGISMGNDLIELRSNSSEDNTFVYSDGIYTKNVKKAECSNIRKCWIFATYENEHFEVLRINCNLEQIMIMVDISNRYISELMDVNSTYDMGREIYGWCDINKFSSFYILFDDYSNQLHMIYKNPLLRWKIMHILNLELDIRNGQEIVLMKRTLCRSVLQMKKGI